MIVNNLAGILYLKLKLGYSLNKAVIFGLPSGELQFTKSIIKKLYKDIKNTIIIAHWEDDSFTEFRTMLPELFQNVAHIQAKYLNLFSPKEVALYISSDGLGIKNIYSIYTFHGQPSKGLTFTHGKLDQFDALFLYGNLHKESLTYFVKKHLNGKLPEHLSVYKVGYPKSDDLINNRLNREEILGKLKLPLNKPVILYAPAFNEGASLRENGVEIITTLCTIPNVSVIASLPVDCREPAENYYANGGVDWYKHLSYFEKTYSNFRLFKGYENNELLLIADLLITCVSSISFEFLVLNKPVIFIDTPRFYSDFLTNYLTNTSIKGWNRLTHVNGGKQYGITIKHPQQLPKVIDNMLYKKMSSLKYRNLIKRMLYNPGNSTTKSVEIIKSLIKQNKQTLRSHSNNLGISDVKQLFINLFSYRMLKLKTILDKNLLKFGYSLNRIGNDYLNANKTIDEAKTHNQSICEYLEQHSDNPNKIGRRDRIIDKLTKVGVFNNAINICEIGAGTGMYLEKIIKHSPVKEYHIYETALDWKDYLRNTFENKVKNMLIHNADGKSLRQTKSGTMDLVHAHGVYVYIPIVDTYEYLKESVRVCKTGGYIVFDVISNQGFTVNAINNWIHLNHRFVVIMPDSFINDFARRNHLTLVDSFTEIYAGSFSKYYVFRK